MCKLVALREEFPGYTLKFSNAHQVRNVTIFLCCQDAPYAVWTLELKQGFAGVFSPPKGEVSLQKEFKFRTHGSVFALPLIYLSPQKTTDHSCCSYLEE